MTDKSKGGRPPAPPGLRRVNVPLRLPEWLVQWMAEQAETPAELIEAALLKAHTMTERIVAENAQLREAVRSARADEAHCWASRVDGLTAQLREVDARYMVLLKAVADGVAMQPKTVVLGLAPNA